MSNVRLSYEQVCELNNKYHRKVKASVIVNSKGYHVAGVSVDPDHVNSSILVTVKSLSGLMYYFVFPISHIKYRFDKNGVKVKRKPNSIKIYFNKQNLTDDNNHNSHWQYCVGYH